MTKYIKRKVTIIFVLIAPIIALCTLGPSSDASAYVQSAKSLFASKCSVCHGNDGSGSTAKGKELKVRNWRISSDVKKMTEAQMVDVTLKGKGKMEGYEKTLGKEKVQTLIAYARELMSKE